MKAFPLLITFFGALLIFGPLAHAGTCQVNAKTLDAAARFEQAAEQLAAVANLGQPDVAGILYSSFDTNLRSS